MNTDKPDPSDLPDEVFDAPAIAKRIEQLEASGERQGALNEIRRPWPGMDGDIGMAAQALMAELSRNGSAPLYFKDVQFDEANETVAVQFPDWFEDTRGAFIERYPSSVEAGLRFQKTMTLFYERLRAAYQSQSMTFAELADVLKGWLPEEWFVKHGGRVH